MNERIAVSGIGFAMVDAKIRVVDKSITKLPDNPRVLASFLESKLGVELKAGGATTNTLIAYIGMAKDSQVSLFAAIGNDERGNFLQCTTPANLGELQRIEGQPTGTIAYLLSRDGDCLDSQSFFGAATEASVSENILRGQKDSLFIANCATLINTKTAKEVHKAVDEVRNKGFFALNLKGVTVNIVHQPELSSSISGLSKKPDIVMGNESEALQFTGKHSVIEALTCLFPKSRLVVVTRGDKGSVIRFENTVIHIPVFLSTTVIDSTGAGDCYMGIMLACLFENPYKSWTLDEVRISATTASYAAAKIVGQLDSRLLPHQYREIRLMNECLKNAIK